MSIAELFSPRIRSASFALALGLVACSGGDGDGAERVGSPNPADPVDAPIIGLPRELEAVFNDGDLLFSTPVRESDGLGPLYTRAACSSCHQEAVRGPGLVQKMAIVEADGVTPASDQSALEYGHTTHPLLAGGGRTPILPPASAERLKVTVRIGPPVIGRGYLEAVEDSEIERVEREQAARTDGIHGRINRVSYGSEPNVDDRFHGYRKGDALIGRFGLKARIGTLDDFTADAFQGDMGITSPLRPEEFANPDALRDDMKPGIDVDYESVNLRAMYLRLLAIPRREKDERGAALFEQSLCSVCHVPSLHTRADYPVPNLAGIQAPIYSDLLLHRMGDELSDGLPTHPDLEGDASAFEWRTAPLIGLRFDRTFLHDGRAKDIEQAILLHRGTGSEANPAVDRFEELSAADRAALVKFVEGL